jgi:hypothetical protein
MAHSRRAVRKFSNSKNTRLAAAVVESLERRQLLSGVSFSTQTSYPVGGSPDAVKTADFNGDGKLDLVSANINGTISLLLGNGDGTFQAAQTFTDGLGNSPSSQVGMALFPFSNNNNNNTIGVALVDDSEQVSLMIGNGNGTFQAPEILTLSDTVSSVAVGDFTGDGNADIVVGYSNGDVGVLLGNDDGTFQTPQTYVAADYAITAVAVADLTNTGHEDIAVSSSGNNGNNGSIAILLGNGDGTFGGEQPIASESYGEFGLGAIDLNGDGIPDLIAGTNTGAYQVFLGNGDGTFHSPIINSQTNIDAATITDLTGDGTVDRVTVNFVTDTVGFNLGNGNGTFRNVANVLAGNTPVDVTPGDFNGDGQPDVVVANAGSNSLSVLLNTTPRPASNLFASPTKVKVAGDPSTEVSAALTGNGISDLVVLNKQNSTVSILLGNGDGTFQAAHTYTGINYPRTVAVADVNGDGHPDIVIGGENGDVDVMLGNGDGTFKAPIKTNIDPNGGNIIVATADLTGDGDQDIIAADRSDGLLGIVLNNGNGVFAPPRLYSVGNHPSSIAVGNLGNGHADILVANEYAATVSVLLGNGDGTFRDAPTLSVGDNPESIALADLNGDGKLDLIVGDDGAYYQKGDTASLNVFLGNGDGTFKPPTKTVLQGDRLGEVAVGDLTGDGKQDVAVTTGYQQAPTDFVDVLVGNGDGTLQPPATFVVLNSPGTISLADVNDDGKLDIVVPDEQHARLSVLLNTASPLVFTAPKLIHTGNGPVSVVTADLNGDGIPDLVEANQVDNTVQVFLGNGNGTFKTPETYSVDSVPEQVLVANLGNGHLDIVEISQSSGDVTVLVGDGSGHFTQLQAFATTTIASGPNPMALADLSGNGKMDLVVADPSSGMITVYTGNGDGTFDTSGSDYTLPMGTYSPSAFAVTAGVFTGTLPDIAVTDPDNNQVDVFLNNGSGGLDSVPGTYPVGLYPTSIAVADFNGDSKQDLVVADKYGSEVSVLLGNGDGTFAPQQTLPTGKYPTQVIAADVNGDGKMDIITANTGNSDSLGHSVDILTGNGDGTFAAPQVLLTGNYPRSVAAADFNGDGTLDLVVAARADNNLDLFLGGKPTITSGSGGAVTVTGSGGNDMTTVGYAGGKVIINIDGQSQTFTKTSLGTFAIMLGDGNDTLSVGAGVPAVSILGGSGNSSIIAGSASATIRSGTGNDFIVSSGRASSIKANGGNDDLVADAKVETIKGGHGIDTIDPLKGGDSLRGGGGTSFFLDSGAKHPDTINGGSGLSFAQYNPADAMSNIFQLIDPPAPLGSDAIESGGAAASVAPADAGTVTSSVSDGELKIVGSTGNDTISLTTDGTNIDISADGSTLTPVPLAGLSDILVNGRGGNNSISVASGITLPATLHGHHGADTLMGGGGDNVLIGGGGDDSLVGGADTNLLIPGLQNTFSSTPSGNATLNGGTGFSIADFSYRTDKLTLSNNGQATSGDVNQGEGIDIMPNVSAIWGGTAGDTIVGTVPGVFLSGGDGANSVHGGGANDLLVGGGGNDTVIVAAEPVSLYLINGSPNEYGGVNNPSEDILQLDSLDSVIG